MKEPRDICEGVSYPVWDFVEPSHYILPELYIEIGLLNNALDNFYDWVEDHVESASEEEKFCRNWMILLDSDVSNAISMVEQWNTTNGMEWEEKQCTIAELQHSLSSRTLPLSEFQRPFQQQCQFSAEVAALVERQKLLEADVSTRTNLSQLQKKN